MHAHTHRERHSPSTNVHENIHTCTHTHTHTPHTDLALVQSTQSGHLLLKVVDAALFGQCELVLHQGKDTLGSRWKDTTCHNYCRKGAGQQNVTSYLHQQQRFSDGVVMSKLWQFHFDACTSNASYYENSESQQKSAYAHGRYVTVFQNMQGMHIEHVIKQRGAGCIECTQTNQFAWHTVGVQNPVKQHYTYTKYWAISRVHKRLMYSWWYGCETWVHLC